MRWVNPAILANLSKHESMQMVPSNNCILIVKHYERFYANPYLCPAGVATIGYGTTVYPNGVRVSLRDAPISEEVAVELMTHDLFVMAGYVNQLLKVKINQDQFDALVDITYNIGPDIDKDTTPEGLGDSHLLKLVNQNIMKTEFNWKKIISQEFMKWVHGGGKKIPGLIARRSSDALLFCDGVVKYFN